MAVVADMVVWADKLWHLVVGTAIGALPGTLATTVLGGQIESALTGGRFNWWLVGGVALALLAGVWYVKRWFSKMAGRMDVQAGSQPR